MHIMLKGIYTTVVLITISINQITDRKKEKERDPA